jgi:tRNA(Ile)-lysidine synthase
VADLLKQVARCITRRALIQRGETVVVAVSGGLDSMVLLHLLHRLSRAAKWRLVVAHFNHQLRSRASDADEAFVRRAAERLGLPCVVGHAEIGREAATRKLSIEMAARECRHAFLAQTARLNNAGAVALAHHADDQVETFFLRLLRGTGGSGLAGMKFASPSPADARIRLVRPLLAVTRAELAAFARRHRIRFREDASNALTDVPRNRLRHELLPRFRQFQPALNTIILRTMELVGDDAAFADEAARRWLRRRRRRPFAGLAVAVQRRVLQAQLRELGVAAEFERIEQLRLTTATPIAVKPNLRVWRDAAGTLHAQRTKRLVFDTANKVVVLAGQRGEIQFAARRFHWSVTTGGPPARRLTTVDGREWFDADRVGRRIVLRHWRPGDRFQPIGLDRAAKLQDLFTNAKVPGAERRRRVVAATGEGVIFWVEGLRIGERFKLTAATQHRLIWRWT